MLIKISDDLVVETTAIVAIETVTGIAIDKTDYASKIILRVEGTVICIICNKRVSEIYSLL